MNISFKSAGDRFSLHILGYLCGQSRFKIGIEFGSIRYLTSFLRDLSFYDLGEVTQSG